MNGERKNIFLMVVSEVEVEVQGYLTKRLLRQSLSTEKDESIYTGCSVDEVRQ